MNSLYYLFNLNGLRQVISYTKSISLGTLRINNFGRISSVYIYKIYPVAYIVSCLVENISLKNLIGVNGFILIGLKKYFFLPSHLNGCRHLRCLEFCTNYRTKRYKFSLSL